jgi:hypothetical protein
MTKTRRVATAVFGCLSLAGALTALIYSVTDGGKLMGLLSAAALMAFLGVVAILSALFPKWDI